MNIDFESRTVGVGEYYITEKEATILCKQSDPNGHHIPILPKCGWSRQVRYEDSWYWLSKRIIDGDLMWTLKELD